MQLIKCGFFGAIVEEKGYDRIIKVLENNKDINLLVIGALLNPAHKKTLKFLKDKEKELRNLRLINKFIKEKEFEKYIKEIDIMLFPYHKITSSGMFCKLAKYLKPVICWNLPYFKEIEEKYDACITVNSVEELEEMIIKISESKVWKQFLKEGMEKFMDNLSWDKTALKYLEVYNKL